MVWCGRLAYGEALHQMQETRAALLSGQSTGTLTLCEHAPVITRGRHSNDANLLLGEAQLQEQGIELVALERGGDLSYHGPGQLMIYPVLHVGVGVRKYLRTIAEALAALAASYGVDDARWREEEPGLWVGDRKLAACGLHLSRGVSIHGYAFNVSTPPEDWSCIVPCGLSGPGPISLAQALGQGSAVPSVQEVAKRLEPILYAALRPYGLDSASSDSLR